MKNNYGTYDEEAAMAAAQERCAEPHFRDVLKRERDEAQARPRNIALEKWGPMLEEKILHDLECRGTAQISGQNACPKTAETGRPGHGQ